MAHADTEREPASADKAERESALGQLHRVLHLDGYDGRAHLDAVDLAQRDAERDGQVGVVGKLSHPDPAEALVA
jgi:hypothetical protein